MTTSAQTTPSRSDGTALIEHDPWLEPYANPLRERYMHYLSVKRKIEQTGGLLGQISQGYKYFGFNRGQHDGKAGVWYREWAPSALQLRLVGDFNQWDRMANPLVRDQYGVWSIFLPDDEFGNRLVHSSR